MSDTIPNITVTAEDWVDLNTVSGVAIGTAMQITNEGGGWVLLHEATAKPLLSDKSGKKLTTKQLSESVGTISAGSNTIWAKAITTSFDSEVNISV